MYKGSSSMTSQQISRFEWIFDRLDWWKYLIISRWHLFRGHYLFRYRHCDSLDCTFDLVLCLNCDNKKIGWLDLE